MKVNLIVLTKEDHGDKLFEVMGELLKILTTSGYVCKVRVDEPSFGIYVIEYDYDDPKLTSTELVWIDSEKQFIGEVEQK